MDGGEGMTDLEALESAMLELQRWTWMSTETLEEAKVRREDMKQAIRDLFKQQQDEIADLRLQLYPRSQQVAQKRIPLAEVREMLMQILTQDDPDLQAGSIPGYRAEANAILKEHGWSRDD